LGDLLPERDPMVLMEVNGVYTSSKSAYPQVVLKEKAGRAYLPIVIGRFEAAAIAAAQGERKPDRPISYDLALALLGMAEAKVARVEITELHEGTYYAAVHLQTGDGSIAVLDSRPSDALALALRQGAPIYASPEVLQEAGYVRPDEEPEPAKSVAASQAEPVPATAAPVSPTTAEVVVDESAPDQLGALERRLLQAVAEEVYEEAARLRDEISRIKRETQGS
jgi:bifunctional DNase/RNase